MKKILLTTTAIAMLATSNAHAAKDIFYVTAGIGLAKLNKIYHKKSDQNATVNVGIGYKIMDNVRVDVTIDHMINTRFAGKSANGSKEKIKADATSLMWSTYVDLFDISICKVFAGASIGTSRIKGKTRITDAAGKKSSKKHKLNYTFAYAAHVGGAVEVAPGIYGELKYSWKNLGRLKYLKKRLRGHTVNAGVRFEF